MHSKTRSLILAALFAALTAIGAFLKIPLGALSLTLQFFFTAMAGVLLGPRWGAASQAVYVALGLAGLPVFTMGGGLGYVPSGGGGDPGPAHRPGLPGRAGGTLPGGSAVYVPDPERLFG